MECSFQVHKPESFNVNVALKQSLKNYAFARTVLNADLFPRVGFKRLSVILIKPIFQGFPKVPIKCGGELPVFSELF